MVQEIGKEVSGNIDRLTLKTQNLGIKLAGFIVTTWLLIGTLGIGIVAPVYVVKSLMKTEWVREAKAANVERSSERAPRISAAYPNVRYYGYAQVRRQDPQPTLKSGLRETRDTLSEVRSLSRGVRALVSR